MILTSIFSLDLNLRGFVSLCDRFKAPKESFLEVTTASLESKKQRRFFPIFNRPKFTNVMNDPAFWHQIITRTIKVNIRSRHISSNQKIVLLSSPVKIASHPRTRQLLNLFVLVLFSWLNSYPVSCHGLLKRFFVVHTLITRIQSCSCKHYRKQILQYKRKFRFKIHVDSDHPWCNELATNACTCSACLNFQFLFSRTFNQRNLIRSCLRWIFVDSPKSST